MRSGKKNTAKTLCPMRSLYKWDNCDLGDFCRYLKHLEIRWKLYHLVEMRIEFWFFELNLSLHYIAGVDYELVYQSAPNSRIHLNIRIETWDFRFVKSLWLFYNFSTWRCRYRWVIRLCYWRFYPFDSTLNWLGWSGFWIWRGIWRSLIGWPLISSIDCRLRGHSGQIVCRFWISNVGFIDFISLGKKCIETNYQIWMTLK